MAKRKKFTLQQYKEIAVKYGLTGPGDSAVATCAYCPVTAPIAWRTYKDATAYRNRFDSHGSRLAPNHWISFGGLYIDHVIPLDQDGPHAIENFVLCCYRCSSRKGSKTPQEWLRV